MSDARLYHLLKNSRALVRRNAHLAPRLEAELSKLIPALEREAERRGLVVPEPKRRTHPLDPRIPKAPADDELLGLLEERGAACQRSAS